MAGGCLFVCLFLFCLFVFVLFVWRASVGYAKLLGRDWSWCHLVIVSASLLLPSFPCFSTSWIGNSSLSCREPLSVVTHCLPNWTTWLGSRSLSCFSVAFMASLGHSLPHPQVLIVTRLTLKFMSICTLATFKITFTHTTHIEQGQAQVHAITLSVTEIEATPAYPSSRHKQQLQGSGYELSFTSLARWQSSSHSFLLCGRLLLHLSHSSLSQCLLALDPTWEQVKVSDGVVPPSRQDRTLSRFLL